MPVRKASLKWLEIARGLLSCPTAPLMEDLPVKHIEAFAAARPSLGIQRDDVGNLLVGFPKRKRPAKDPLVLVAHLDHPGFWVKKVSGKRVDLTFKGGVGLSHARLGTRVRFYRRGSLQAIGRGHLVGAGGSGGRLEKAVTHIQTGIAEPNGFAMWDFPPFSLRRGKIVTRCCDDLLGAAAALCVLDELSKMRKSRSEINLWCLFTRAEEIGFLGALAAVRGGLLPKDARVISLECSRALPQAPQGGGVIVRVGDRMSMFDPRTTEALCQGGELLRKQNPGPVHKRSSKKNPPLTKGGLGGG